PPRFAAGASGGRGRLGDGLRRAVQLVDTPEAPTVPSAPAPKPGSLPLTLTHVGRAARNCLRDVRYSRRAGDAGTRSGRKEERCGDIWLGAGGRKQREINE